MPSSLRLIEIKDARIDNELLELGKLCHVWVIDVKAVK